MKGLKIKTDKTKIAEAIKDWYYVLFLPAGILLFYGTANMNSIVEKVYSTHIFKYLAQLLSLITGIFPFSLAEVVIVLMILFIVWRAALLIRNLVKVEQGRRTIILSAIRKIAGAVSVIYFIFVVFWGLNYNRKPFAELAGLEVKPASVEELARVCMKLAERCNSLRLEVEEDSNGVMKIKNGKKDALKRAEKGYNEAACYYPVLAGKYGRPKGVKLSFVMSYTGTAGIYSVFTAEPNVDMDMPDCDIPNTACHEMAHQRGFAREDEANYIAYLTCEYHPDADFRYSGALLGLIYAGNALYEHSPEKYKQVRAVYSPGVVRDLKAISDFWSKYEGPVENISSSINDTYLKANRQSDGVESYGRMVDLLIAEYRANGS